MHGTEILTTIAQLAVGVIGFSGIAIAFNRQPGRLNDWEAFRVLILFTNGFAAAFLSLLPFAFFYLDWSDAGVWRMSSGLCALFEIIFLRAQTAPTRRMMREHPELFNVALLTMMISGHALNTLLQLANALGLVGPRTLPIFIFGVLWLLFQSVFQFGRILFVQPMSGGAVSHATPSDSREENEDRHPHST